MEMSKPIKCTARVGYPTPAMSMRATFCVNGMFDGRENLQPWLTSVDLKRPGRWSRKINNSDKTVHEGTFKQDLSAWRLDGLPLSVQIPMGPASRFCQVLSRVVLWCGSLHFLLVVWWRPIWLTNMSATRNDWYKIFLRKLFYQFFHLLVLMILVATTLACWFVMILLPTLDSRLPLP